MIHIKSGVLLGVFSLFLLHQMIPHQHHEHQAHDAISHNVSKSHHSHDNEHRHDHDEKDNSESLFLDLFLEIHSHGNNSSTAEYAHANIVVKKQKTLNVEVSLANTVLANFELSHLKQDKSLQSYSSPEIAFNAYLVRPDLRGPPTLG